MRRIDESYLKAPFYGSREWSNSAGDGSGSVAIGYKG